MNLEIIRFNWAKKAVGPLGLVGSKPKTDEKIFLVKIPPPAPKYTYRGKWIITTGFNM